MKIIISRSRQRRKVVFLDEVPWMDTQKSEFKQALDLFWNSWGMMQPNLLFIICGSAASWMVKNVINDKGGLHNRLTCKLHLMPFTLKDTKAYLRHQGFRWTDELVANCYMILGGIMYTIGAALYGIGKKVKYMHCIFHIFCILGTFFHFWAIYMYMI